MKGEGEGLTDSTDLSSDFHLQVVAHVLTRVIYIILVNFKTI